MGSEGTLWIAIFTLGLVGLNWPVLEIFHENVFWYLLLFWLLLMALVARAARRGPEPPAR